MHPTYLPIMYISTYLIIRYLPTYLPTYYVNTYLITEPIPFPLCTST
jgi:hypothetical protein